MDWGLALESEEFFTLVRNSFNEWLEDPSTEK
jgi:hypothetical protein